MSDASDNGWPGEPGVPLNPERAVSWHWLETSRGTRLCCYWQREGYWTTPVGDSALTPDQVGDWRYLGVALTPAQHAAAVEAAYKQGWTDREADIFERSQSIGVCDAAVEAARAEERERAAREIDCGCDMRDAVLARLESDGRRKASYLCQHGDICCALQAADVRALAPAEQRADAAPGGEHTP